MSYIRKITVLWEWSQQGHDDVVFTAIAHGRLMDMQQKYIQNQVKGTGMPPQEQQNRQKYARWGGAVKANDHERLTEDDKAL